MAIYINYHVSALAVYLVSDYNVDSFKKLYILKGCPDPNTPPTLVDPSTRLLDLQRFTADLPKYKPFLGPQAWQAWEEFIQTCHKLDETRSDAF